ncbi:MAG: UDP-N-acetylmuramate dehydrogenase [Deltaproteobacteria bacterium]|nr:UDP-N-acetylmuramate dehydrogenase [Deltaproteobacteria bacterium]
MQDARCKIKNKTYNLQLATCIFKGRILFDVPMKDYTSFKIGGNADVMVFPQDEHDLIDVIGFASNKGFPVLVIGRGTNLLVRDNGIRGVVINLSNSFKEITWVGDDEAIVGGGVGVIELINLCKERGLSGLEFAVGIPGTIGGAVFMNAGAYGGEMKDAVKTVEAVDLNGKRHSFDKSALKFSYRKCDLPENMIISKVRLKLRKDSAEEIKKRIKEFKERRKAAQAIVLPNAGSIFKNPEGLYAGRLIEESGLKGSRVGDAQISEMHGNYIVNLGNATAMDVLTLIAMARDKVFKAKGILLETEIKVVGED